MKDFNAEKGDSAYTMGIVDLLLECVELSSKPGIFSHEMLLSSLIHTCLACFSFFSRSWKMLNPVNFLNVLLFAFFLQKLVKLDLGKIYTMLMAINIWFSLH